MVEQEDPELTLSQGHNKTTTAMLQLPLKMTQILEEQIFYNYSQRDHIKKDKRSRDVVRNQTPA